MRTLEQCVLWRPEKDTLRLVSVFALGMATNSDDRTTLTQKANHGHTKTVTCLVDMSVDANIKGRSVLVGTESMGLKVSRGKGLWTGLHVLLETLNFDHLC